MPARRPVRRTFGLFSLLASLLAMFGLYGLRRQIVSRWLKLRPPRYKVAVYPGVRIPMPDGAALAADHYSPAGSRLYPTILIRTPYGRNPSAGFSGWLASFAARRFAERGYNVIVQDVRGRFDSRTGQDGFDPFRSEAADGRATFDWIEKQRWFNGMLGMWGASYLGYTQWAAAPEAPLYLKALFPVMSGSQLPIAGMRDGALGADMLLRWIFNLENGQAGTRLGRLRAYFHDRAVRRGADALPLSQADRRAVGRPVPFFQEWLAHPDVDDDYWQAVIPHAHLDEVAASVHLMGGWYDILLRETLEDYRALRRLERKPYLTIGPWTHLDPAGALESIRQGLGWFDATLKGDPNRLGKLPVRIYLMGAGRWLELENWPPPARLERIFLQPGGSLSFDSPAASAPDVYTYDPAHPTPAIGGPLMSLHAGRVDNRPLEARPDVLTYTTGPLPADLPVIGSAHLALYACSDRANTDFFVRLSEVDANGRSLNVTDGFVRLGGRDNDWPAPGGDSIQRIEIELWPTAYLFRRGSRLRLLVSSGAHPRWSRNPGSGEPLATAVRLSPARQSIYHDPAHPSALALPVIQGLQL